MSKSVAFLFVRSFIFEMHANIHLTFTGSQAIADYRNVHICCWSGECEPLCSHVIGSWAELCFSEAGIL
jgi:hypothetical protein